MRHALRTLRQPAPGLKRVKAGGLLACPACIEAGPPETVPQSRSVLDTPPLKENYGEVIRRAREAKGGPRPSWPPGPR